MQNIGPQFTKLAEISRFLCLDHAIGQFSKNVCISSNLRNLSPILHVLYKGFCNYGSKITFSKKCFYWRRVNIINWLKGGTAKLNLQKN